MSAVFVDRRRPYRRLTRAEIEEHERTATAVITPSMPERAELLVECRQSVIAQTVGVQHLVMLDSPLRRMGPAVIRSFLLGQTKAETVAFLDDDDLIDPDHIETLLAALNDEQADIAMSWYRREGTAPETPRIEQWDDWAWGTMIGGRNLIPVTVVARRESILRAGAFRAEDRYEDYALWMRMLEQGCTVAVVSRETWTYRCLGENRTWA